MNLSLLLRLPLPNIIWCVRRVCNCGSERFPPSGREWYKRLMLLVHSRDVIFYPGRGGKPVLLIRFCIWTRLLFSSRSKWRYTVHRSSQEHTGVDVKHVDVDHSSKECNNLDIKNTIHFLDCYYYYYYTEELHIYVMYTM